MKDEQKASEAIRKLAEYKMKQSGANKRIEDKGKLKLSQLGIDPMDAARSAALMKLVHDASQGRIDYNSGDFNVEGQLTPEEKRLKFGWKKDF